MALRVLVPSDALKIKTMSKTIRANGKERRPVDRNRNKNGVSNPNRRRKHLPYGYHTSKFHSEYKDWFDCQERHEAANCQNKSAARQEGKREIEKQLNEQ